MKGFGNLMFLLWFTFLGGFFVFLDVDPSILFLVLPLFWVLWFFMIGKVSSFFSKGNQKEKKMMKKKMMKPCQS